MPLIIELFDLKSRSKTVKKFIGSFEVASGEYTSGGGQTVEIDLTPPEKTQDRPNALAVKSNLFRGRRVVDMSPKKNQGETQLTAYLGLRVKIRQDQ